MRCRGGCGGYNRRHRCGTCRSRGCRASAATRSRVIVKPSQIEKRWSDQRQTRRAIRILSGVAKADRGSQRMPDEGRLRDSQLLHEIIQQLNLLGKSVLTRFLAGVAKTPEIERVSAVLHAELLHGRYPVAPGAKPAMHKNDRTATAQHFVVDKVVFNRNGAHSVSRMVASYMPRLYCRNRYTATVLYDGLVDGFAAVVLGVDGPGVGVALDACWTLGGVLGVAAGCAGAAFSNFLRISPTRPASSAGAKGLSM